MVAGEGVQRAGFADGRLEPLGKCQEVLRVAAAALAELSGGTQSLEGVLAHRVEHGEAWLGVAAHQLAQQAVVDEGGERVQRGAADRFGGIQRAAAREHRQPGEQRPLTGPEQLVAPVDGGAQRVLTCGGVASAGRQQIQAVLQPREHRRGVEQLRPRGGQLERERKTVHGPADAGDGARVRIGQREVGANGPRAGHEQRHRLAEGQGLDRRVGAGRRECEWRHRVLVLAGQAQGGAAGHERLCARRRRQQAADQRRRRQQMLEVVEQQQHFTTAQRLLEVVGPVGHADRGGDRRGDQVRLRERSEVDERRPVLEVGLQRGSHLERHPRLARAAGAGEREQSHVGATQQRGGGGHLEAATDERRRGEAEVERHPARPAGAARRGQGRGGGSPSRAARAAGSDRRRARRRAFAARPGMRRAHPPDRPHRYRASICSRRSRSR